MNILKKSFAFILCLILMFTLNGCVYEAMNTNINEDGSGSIKISVGVSEELLQIGKALGIEEMNLDLSDAVRVRRADTYYYVKTIENKFSNVKEFNSLFSNPLSEEIGSIDIGSYRLSQNEDGSFVLVIDINEQTGTVAMSEELDSLYTEGLEEDLLLEFVFNFPSKVTQIAGNSEGVFISNNILSLDIEKIGMLEKDRATYCFTDSENPKTVKFVSSNFKDVSNNAWYFNSVNVLAEKGIVTGTGERMFLPENTISTAEVCAIISRVKGFSLSKTNSYWAYDAIKSCIDAGYIEDLGAINEEIYQKSITREEAISTIYLAFKEDLVNFESDFSYNSDNIPDFNEINIAYQDNILNAYNSNITHGVDDDFTFSPKSSLTRAEFCQLIYNVSNVLEMF